MKPAEGVLPPSQRCLWDMSWSMRRKRSCFTVEPLSLCIWATAQA